MIDNAKKSDNVCTEYCDGILDFKEKSRLLFLCLLLAFFLPSKTVDLFEYATGSQNFLVTHQARAGAETDLLKILIVPGHDDEVWGAQHLDLKEVELNRHLGELLHAYLLKDPRTHSVLVSDVHGYTDDFDLYFNSEKNTIQEFIASAKQKFFTRIEQNNIRIADHSFHNVATEDVARTLYGINFWANREHFDIVIHIHFNDYRGRARGTIGKYSGFSVYAPSGVLSNHEVSQKLSEAVFDEIKKIRPVSNLASESSGMIERHELIALGAYDTLDAASILVEYGYIYEDIFTNPELRNVSLDFLAYATYVGIKNFLNETPIPKDIQDVTPTENKKTPDNLVWQFENARTGIYPPSGKTLRQCPIDGFSISC